MNVARHYMLMKLSYKKLIKVVFSCVRLVCMTAYSSCCPFAIIPISLSVPTGGGEEKWRKNYVNLTLSLARNVLNFGDFRL